MPLELAFDFASATREIVDVFLLNTFDLKSAVGTDAVDFESFLRAARTSLDLLEREGTYARRGHKGVRVESVALTAALYCHGESRPSVHDDGR
jgi:hypothetical protein